MSNIILRVENLRKDFGNVAVLKNISLDVRRGEVTVAAIYFLLSRLLLKLTDKLARRLDPKRRSREKILDGVKL